MLLISFQPFAFRKIFVLAAAILGLSSAACFADSLFMSLHPIPVNKPMARPSQMTLPAIAPGFAAKDPLFRERQNDGVVTEDTAPTSFQMDYAPILGNPPQSGSLGSHVALNADG
jgi:hypothetical protein